MSAQKAFAARLLAALAKAGMPASPTRLQRSFNLISSDKPVTVHAVRKWLVGEAIPTQFKLVLLAEMVGVDVNWLRYGDGEPAYKAPEQSLEQREAVAAVLALSPRACRAVATLAQSLKEFS